MPAPRFDDGLLAEQLGAAVDPGGVGRLLLGTGGVVEVAAENVVGRNVDEEPADLVHGDSKISDGRSVKQLGEGGIVLGLVDVGIGGAIDDGLDMLVLHGLQHGVGVGDVELGDVGEEVTVLGMLCDETELAAQLAVGSGDQDIHR